MVHASRIPQSTPCALDIDSPELISANELNGWADLTDAKASFPELVRRLLAQTPGITNIDMRAHEGTAAHGWDGRATSTGSVYLPAGELRFELGTNKRVEPKANDDYRKRVEQLGSDAYQYVYVFATPRNWPGGQRWADGRRKEQIFADVRVIDAHTFEGWLQATPVVHYWISERLGRRPQEAVTLSAWWKRFHAELNISVPPQFFQARRDEQAQQLLDRLQAKESTKPESISSTCIEDILAFIYATLKDQSELADRTVIVASDLAWSNLIESATPLLLVPKFSNPDIGGALNRKHRVLTIIDNTKEHSRGDATISLSKIGREEAAETLRKANVDFRSAERLTALARRSMPAFLRSISQNPAIQNPTWLRDADATAVLPSLVLVGAWEDGDECDEKHVEAFIDVSMKKIRRRLVSLSQEADPPFILSGSVWRLADPVDAARLLLPLLDSTDVQRWECLVRDVLLAPDPYYGKDMTEKLTAQLKGVRPGSSGTLRRHVAEGLALVATSSDQLAPTVRGIVKLILDEAFADTSGKTLGSLASAFPMLAEAAPEEFLAALANDLDQSEPITRMLFQEPEKGFFGTSSLYSHLTYALEILCWSPHHYDRAAMALAAIADIDPNCRVGNRAIGSLEKVTAVTLVRSAADVKKKIDVIKAVADRFPDVAWNLILDLQQLSQFIDSGGGPRYRDWELPGRTITNDERVYYVEAFGGVAISVAGEHSDRWASLIKARGGLSVETRTKILECLACKVESGVWESEDRHVIWASLTWQIQRQQSHPDAKWAMSVQQIAQMEKIAKLLESFDDPRRYSHLFQWEQHIVVNRLRYNDDGFQERLHEERFAATKNISEMGADAVRVLASDVARPDLIGAYLAITQALDDISVIGWLDDVSEQLQQVASSYACNRLDSGDFAWLKEMLDNAGLSIAGQNKLIGLVPMTKTWWTQVESLGERLVAAYWNSDRRRHVPPEEQLEAVNQLIHHDQPWRALEVLNQIIYDGSPCDPTLVKGVLNSISTAAPSNNVQGYSSGILEALKWLESTVPDDVDLPALEFRFFDLIDDREPADALYWALGNAPSCFVHLVKAVRSAESSTLTGRNDESYTSAYKKLAWKVLCNWSRIPGLNDDKSIDAEHLAEWVGECRRRLTECGRTKVGDDEIGNVLSRCPEGEDGIWPAEVVRSLLEQLKNPDIENGIVRGRVNQRGVSVRGVYDGGKQEGSLAQQYRTDANKLELDWPRTASILRRLAEDYQSWARYIDQRDEERADEG
ncbi:hypothetical protein [Actinomyces howellii]|nr:hypothetical protein [Actinomyces howellii]